MASHEDDEREVEAVMDELMCTLPAGKQARLREVRGELLARAMGRSRTLDFSIPDDVAELFREVRQQAVETVVYRHGVIPARWRHLMSRERANGRAQRVGRGNGRHG